jgi:phosphonopyruvate decarboxylase
MVDPRELFETLHELGVSLYAGVPDSLLKSFCGFVTDQCDQTNHVRHVITANEGSAVALAAGHYLATNELAVVYMQNSGLGNAINPLASLTDPSIYGIPLILLIGWRGEPGTKDEPQHLLQGEKTIPLLKTLEIPYAIFDASANVQMASQEATSVARKRSGPYAFVVRENTFKPYHIYDEHKSSYSLTREDALKVVLSSIGETAIVVSTTGLTSRELFEYREALGQGHGRDFLTVGSMGHASQIALGIALSRPDKVVYCLDGDGACLMHMGSLAILGSAAPRNFRHIILNNGAHDSVGGQPTAGFKIDFRLIAKGCGYIHCGFAETADEISKAIEDIRFVRGPALVEIRLSKGARADLGRPTTTPAENKLFFMDYIQR